MLERPDSRLSYVKVAGGHWDASIPAGPGDYIGVAVKCAVACELRRATRRF